jgi:hypothetical protein
MADGNPLGAGDPDGPDEAPPTGRASAAGKPLSAKPLSMTAGDGRASDSVMMWRIRAYLLSLRSWYFRY